RRWDVCQYGFRCGCGDVSLGLRQHRAFVATGKKKHRQRAADCGARCRARTWRREFATDAPGCAANHVTGRKVCSHSVFSQVVSTIGDFGVLRQPTFRVAASRVSSAFVQPAAPRKRLALYWPQVLPALGRLKPLSTPESAVVWAKKRLVQRRLSYCVYDKTIVPLQEGHNIDSRCVNGRFTCRTFSSSLGIF